jgi:hypothetical protein
MPWKETTLMAERIQCLVDYRSGLFTVIRWPSGAPDDGG